MIVSRQLNVGACGAVSKGTFYEQQTETIDSVMGCMVIGPFWIIILLVWYIVVFAFLVVLGDAGRTRLRCVWLANANPRFARVEDFLSVEI
jgi:hypothetical protein